MHGQIPKYFTPQQLASQGFNVDQKYKPKCTIQQLNENLEEGFEDLYNRNTEVLRKILSETEGNILIVAHAISLDTCTRIMCRKELKSEKELSKLFLGVGFCGMVMMEKNSNGGWTFEEPPSKPISSEGNKTFHWHSLQ